MWSLAEKLGRPLSLAPGKWFATQRDWFPKNRFYHIVGIDPTEAARLIASPDLSIDLGRLNATIQDGYAQEKLPNAMESKEISQEVLFSFKAEASESDGDKDGTKHEASGAESGHDANPFSQLLTTFPATPGDRRRKKKSLRSRDGKPSPGKVAESDEADDDVDDGQRARRAGGGASASRVLPTC
eukprot:gene24829-28051_t